MAKLTSDLSNPLKGRVPNQKLGGRAKRPFLTDTKHPSPSRGIGQRKGKRK